MWETTIFGSQTGLGRADPVTTIKSVFFSKKLSKIEKVDRGSPQTSHKLALQEKSNRLSINPRENNQSQKNYFSGLAGQIQHWISSKTTRISQNIMNITAFSLLSSTLEDFCESQDWNQKKIKYVWKSSRRDLFESAIVFYEKSVLNSVL